MNTHTTVNKAKIRHLCSCLVLCLQLASGAVPGPCQYSVTEEHLLTLRKLIMNQVQSGCSISFKFTERQHLSDVCYIKAALPHILDLLLKHFTYENGSDNYYYTSSLKDLIHNIYSNKCVPPVNEEIEENPVTFARLYWSLPREGLEKTEEVFQMYKKLMSENDKAVNWNCEDEYANNVLEATTVLPTQTTGTTECECSCPHTMKAFLFTTSAPAASPSSPHTQSGAYTFKNNYEEPSAPEPADKVKTSNSTPNQISALSPFPGPLRLLTKPELIHEESTNFITSSTPNVMDNSSDSSVAMGSDAQPVTSSPISSTSELTSITTGTDLLSATSQPSEKNNTPLISKRDPVLSKRSLDNRDQGMHSDSSPNLLWSWITKGIRVNKMVKVLEITPGETENQPVDHVEQNSPTQLHIHMDKSLLGNVFKIISKDPNCKDSRCDKSTEDRSDQSSRGRVERHTGEKEYHLVHISVYSTFLITAACVLLLFITAVFYYKQQRIKNLQKEVRTLHL
ncbi:macrophage colony-stimulating factor 1a [Tachysurus fulvidraco]|uniref:macrophage colony-stimulating factor 1a n=1 Tax=Tachysurus fulvidraco TaxID=1234273 RepID=UPI001FEE7A26|nr:macrophage colony-stimulating factor 1a [Tachysurus fulvidraco]XP_027000169.2 macrophage colony-stimulating factor 1a [Tachysurus fulvidraco]